MDPATAAGIGMAVMSLAAQCLTGAMHGRVQSSSAIYFFADKVCAAIHLISSAKNLEPEYRYLTVRLRLEQQRLYNWSAEIGLQRYIDENAKAIHQNMLGLNQTLVLDTIFQIQALATDFIKYKNRFGVLVPDKFDNFDDRTWRDDLDFNDLSNFPSIKDFLKKHQHTPTLIKGLPKRLKWATFYKDKYERLINRLRELNDVLINLVDSNTRIAIHQSTRETNTTILHLHSKIDELLQLVKASQAEECVCLRDKTPVALHRDDCLYGQQMHDLAGLARFKAVNVSIECSLTGFATGPNPKIGRAQGLRLSWSEMHFSNDLENTQDRCEADYTPRFGEARLGVWVEWREHDPLMQARPTLNPSRVDKLVSLLNDVHKPDLLRVPHCIGYIDTAECKTNEFETSRLGFIFEKPTQTSASPVSLRALISVQTKPLLTERISLAKAIANSLMSLHSVNWLHKGLRSENILFFPKENGTVEYASPYLSGFGYARPAFREDMTEIESTNPRADMYRHPQTHGLGPWEGRQGFKRTFDIYSLGVILVEVAHWQCIETLLDIKDPNSLSSTALSNIQTRLLSEEHLLDGVGASAGARFRSATHDCLDSMAALGVSQFEDETNIHVAAKVSRNFYQQVLRPLEEIQT